MLWFHGGGWVLGNTRGYDPICAWIADRARVAVLNVDYRLAPEHRAPQAAHDCIDAARWAASDAAGDGVRHTGLGLAGDSAGGNLAAVAAQVLRSEGGADVAYEALVYPAVDATMSSPSVAQHSAAPILTRSDMDAFLAHYLGDGDDALDPLDPLVSPLHADDLTGLPADARPDGRPRPAPRRGDGLRRGPPRSRRRGAAHQLPSRPARLHELSRGHPGRRCRSRGARPVGRPARATGNGRIVCERTRVS